MMRESTQSKLARTREPRVNITYDVAVGGAIEIRSLPFVLGVLSDLSGAPSEPKMNWKFVEINWDNFNDVLAGMKPRLVFAVDDLLTGGGSKLRVELHFRHMQDFEPLQVVNQVKPLADLLAARQQLVGDKTDIEEDRENLAAIDDLLSRQLSRILHAPEFQKLEASWRGLYYLVSQTETGTMLKIRVLNVSKRVLLKDFERAIEVDQSRLFKHVYEEEYGTFAGTPFGALIGDYEFEGDPRDINLLVRLSRVATIAQAPFIAAASSRLFNVDSFNELNSRRDLAEIFNTPAYAKWREFRNSEDSRYVGLTVPRILMRLPYDPWQSPVSSFHMAEDAEENGRHFLWGNAAYAFGVCLMNAFAKYHWCAKIRGVEGGGLVERLPVWTFQTDEGEPALKCPVEVAITDRREKEFADLGFIPLVHCLGTDYAAFFSAYSCNLPRKYDSDPANAHARLAGQLQCVMTTSRFAHYIKVITRDMIGSFVSRGDCERFLNRWILNYVNSDADDEASPAVKAQFPLREARIDVSEVPGKPGAYMAVLFLRPYFQLDELSLSLRLIVELPAPVHL